MIKVADLMLCTPSFLYADHTVSQAKALTGHSRVRGIPVLSRQGNLIGILDRNLMSQCLLPDDALVGSYADSSVVPLNAGDPLTTLTHHPCERMTLSLPVLSKERHLVGVIPDPGFLRTILPGIIEGLTSVIVNDPVDLASYGMIIIDDEGKIVYFNINAESILGMKGRDLYGIHINKVIHDSKLCEVVRKGQPQIKQKLQADRITLCSNRFPLYSGDDVIGAIGIFKDVTENEQLLENLRNLRGLNLEMVGILESISDGIVVADAEGKVVRTNSAFERITGLTANEVLEAPLSCLVERGGLPALLLVEVLQKQNSLNLIESIGGRDFLFIANPVFDCDGRLVRTIVIIKDIDRMNELVLNLQVAQELATRYYSGSESIREHLSQHEMVANSVAMRRVFSLAHKVAQVDSNVLITGETGVGKGIVARAVHKCSSRMAGPFVKVNCGAIPENLLESELFGYESGAFTGAKKEGKSGLIEMADGGTLFLDEVGDLPLNLQVKLLRVLQEREVLRVGGTKYKKVDFRLITATNLNLEERVKGHLFREDLYYRLNVVPVFIPPLRDRKEDIVPLTMSFLSKFNKKYSLSKKLSPEVIKSLLRYDWPGNVRALENTIERLVVTSDRTIIGVEDLREKTRIEETADSALRMLANVVEETEKSLISQVLQQCRTTREMAKMLGISQSAVVKKMKKYQINKPVE